VSLVRQSGETPDSGLIRVLTMCKVNRALRIIVEVEYEFYVGYGAWWCGDDGLMDHVQEAACPFMPTSHPALLVLMTLDDKKLRARNQIYDCVVPALCRFLTSESYIRTLTRHWSSLISNSSKLMGFPLREATAVSMSP
jgi:hypothetical protein